MLLKLIGLMHPAKPDVDAIFHAHRLTDVIAGRRYFTQPFVGGVQMPYAIGLYVFAWPWTWLVTDHVAVIRTVTAVADVGAGALLYPVLVRAWASRRAAALAVLFYQLAPLGYAVLGNANLTNLFGQSVALVVVAAAVSWKLDLAPRRLASAASPALVTWAFCSHVSTITTLLATLGLLVVLYWWRGDRDAQARRRSRLSLSVAAALVVSWFIYYQHFSDEISGGVRAACSPAAPAPNAATAAEAARGYMGTSDRVKDLAGAGRVQRRVADGACSRRSALAVCGGEAFAIAWRPRCWPGRPSGSVFSASTVFSHVDQEFVRYTAEFLGRINLATIPLVAILAAKGAAAGWDDATPSGVRTPLRARRRRAHRAGRSGSRGTR